MTIATSSRFSFRLAGRSEDSALRAVLRSTSMQGKIQLSFQREPNFFRAESAGNLESQVIAVTEESGRMAGFGCRSIRRLFVDGEDLRLGYLSGLRSLPEYRSGTLLIRGYRYLKSLHADCKVPYYITTIFDDNRLAKEVLTSGRAGLPVYHQYASIGTYLLPLYHIHTSRSDLDQFQLAPEDLPAAVNCINRCNKHLQFATVYGMEDFAGESSLLPDFQSRNLFAFRRGDAITATMGLWDQHGFKQSVVAGYSNTLSLLRPASNILAKIGLTPRLPKVGGTLPYLYTVGLSATPGNLDDLIRLLEAVVRSWSRKGYAYLVVGVDHNHPLVPYLAKHAALHLSSTLYLVYWKDTAEFHMPRSGALTNVEIATL